MSNQCKDGKYKKIYKKDPKKTSAAAVVVNSESKIPVYHQNRRASDGGNSTARLSSIRYSNGKLTSSDRLPDLPEHIKLLHHLHNRSTHEQQGCAHSKQRNDRNNLSIPSTATSDTRTPVDSGIAFSTQSSVNSSNKVKNKKKYEEYLPLCEMQKGLQKGEIVEGVLRINPKKFNDAYISAPEGGLDIFIDGLCSRNRALNGDTVAVKLEPTKNWTISYSSLTANWNKWKEAFEALLESNKCDSQTVVKLENLRLNSQDMHKMNSSIVAYRQSECNGVGSSGEAINVLGCEYPQLPLEVFQLQVEQLLALDFWKEFIQRIGKVVCITKRGHSRITGGTIQLNQGQNCEKASKKKNGESKKNRFATFISKDMRIPHVLLPYDSIPKEFINNYDLLKSNLFLVKIDNWNSYSYFPSGKIMESIGECGNVAAETELLLQTYEIDKKDFPNKALQSYREFINNTWTVPPKEFAYRRDFRNDCVFTIDPQSARDLDDAISFKQLSDDRFEIGVHIADVTFFIKESTKLDEIARERATSVYMPDKVIPMLPPLFCQNVCSLNPGQDKLTFSVVFTVDADGFVIDKWIGRTIITSCAKLNYEDAQKMIDSSDGNFSAEEYPRIHGQWSLKHISDCVKTVNSIAQKIRARRFESGSLQLNKSKLSFILDERGLPISLSKYVLKESNKLIEEWMLLANRTVGEHLFERFGREGRAFLRSHPPPNLYNMNEVKNFFQIMSIDFDTSDSLAIHQSLQKLLETKDANHFQVSTNCLIKSMKMAIYNCVSDTCDPESYSHYALNFAMYTHFTSPIRRYADMIVHRLLATSLHYDTVCSDSGEQLKVVAANCNTRKYNAFLVSEGCNQIYLKSYISQIGSLITKAIVYAVYDHSFDVLTIEFDIIIRVYLDQLSLDNFRFNKTANKCPELSLKWNKLDSDCSIQLEQRIQVLQEMDVELTVSDQFKLNAIIAHPNGNYVYK